MKQFVIADISVKNISIIAAKAINIAKSTHNGLAAFRCTHFICATSCLLKAAGFDVILEASAYSALFYTIASAVIIVIIGLPPVSPSEGDIAGDRVFYS
jgi:hypothetical protein